MKWLITWCIHTVPQHFIRKGKRWQPRMDLFWTIQLRINQQREKKRNGALCQTGIRSQRRILQHTYIRYTGFADDRRYHLLHHKWCWTHQKSTFVTHRICHQHLPNFNNQSTMLFAQQAIKRHSQLHLFYRRTKFQTAGRFSGHFEQKNLTDNTIGIYVQGTNGITGNGMNTPANWNPGLGPGSKHRTVWHHQRFTHQSGSGYPDSRRMDTHERTEITDTKSNQKKCGIIEFDYDIFKATDRNEIPEHHAAQFRQRLRPPWCATDTCNRSWWSAWISTALPMNRLYALWMAFTTAFRTFANAATKILLIFKLRIRRRKYLPGGIVENGLRFRIQKTDKLCIQ